MFKDKEIIIETLIDKAEQYGKTSIELYKLKAIDKSTDIFASLASRTVILVIISLFFILLTIAIALYLGDILGKSYYGFFIVSGFYGLVLILLSIFRKPFLEENFNDYIINQIFKEKKNASNQQ